MHRILGVFFFFFTAWGQHWGCTEASYLLPLSGLLGCFYMEVVAFSGRTLVGPWGAGWAPKSEMSGGWLRGELRDVVVTMESNNGL